jgi:hypothetical protein
MYVYVLFTILQVTTGELRQTEADRSKRVTYTVAKDTGFQVGRYRVQKSKKVDTWRRIPGGGEVGYRI